MTSTLGLARIFASRLTMRIFSASAYDCARSSRPITEYLTTAWRISVPGMIGMIGMTRASAREASSRALMIRPLNRSGIFSQASSARKAGGGRDRWR